MEESDPREVYWARAAVDAHAVRALLEDAGIEAFVEGELLLGAVGELPGGPATSPRVFVSAGSESRALQRIAEWEAERRSARSEPPPIPRTPPPPPPPRPASRWRGPWRAVLVFFAWLVGQFAAGFAVGLYAAVTGLSEAEWTTPAYLVAGMAGMLAVYAAARLAFGTGKRKKLTAAVGWRGTTLRGALAGIATGLVLAACWFAYLGWLGPAEYDAPDSPMVELARSSWFGFWTWAALLVVFAPPTEELLFRGAMLHGFMQRWGPTTSVVLTSALFTALHIPETMHYEGAWMVIAGLAVLTSVLRLRTGSLVPPLLAHGVYNGVIVFSVFV